MTEDGSERPDGAFRSAEPATQDDTSGTEVSSTPAGQEADAGEGRTSAPGDFGLDGICDLAWQLTRDEREAETVLDAALQALEARVVRQNGRRQSEPLLCRLRRLVDLLSRRDRRQSLSHARLEVGLARLRPTEHACLILRERLGLSVAEIDQITGLGREQVQLSLFTAREELLAFLTSEGAEGAKVGGNRGETEWRG